MQSILDFLAGHIEIIYIVILSIFLGIEVIFSSVFLSMLGIARDTFIGE